jgi:PIN domain nuclease of toxin-antitoxin system
MLTDLQRPDDLPERIRDSGFQELPITIEHTITAGRLPLLHRDPFDRILIAQAQHEDLTLVTRDAEIQRYDVALLPA